MAPLKIGVNEWRERAKAAPTSRCVCVNAVDKGVSERFGVKTTKKGLTARFGVPLGLARGKKAADSELVALGGCGNRFSGGEKEGIDGDTSAEPCFENCRIRRGVQVALATKLRGVEYGMGYARTTGRRDG